MKILKLLNPYYVYKKRHMLILRLSDFFGISNEVFRRLKSTYELRVQEDLVTRVYNDIKSQNRTLNIANLEKLNGIEIKQLLLNIKQYNYLMHRKEKAHKSTILKSLPISAKISTAEACNLKCIHCGNATDVYRSTHPPYIDGNVLRESIKLIPYLSSANLFREGEPFLWKHIFKLLSYTSFAGCWNKIQTNGSLINDEKARLLVESGLQLLDFSIDGCKKETIEKIRKGLKYEDFVFGVDRINYYKEKLNSRTPVLAWHFVAMKDNIEELPDAVKFAKDKGFEIFSISYCNTEPRRIHEQNLSLYPKLSDEMVTKALKVANLIGIEIYAPNLFNVDSQIEKIGYNNKSSRLSYIKACTIPWESVKIQTNGDVLPCCGGQPAFGNLNKNTLEEIWNSKGWIDLRKSLKSGDIDEYCRHCYYTGLERKCRDTLEV